MTAMNTKHKLLFLVAAWAGCCLARADIEARNEVRIRADKDGIYYAKSIPSERYGTKGQTQIFLKTQTNDVLQLFFDWYSSDGLQFTFNWYSSNVYLQRTGEDVSIVRFGPWPRGHTPSSTDLAIALYLNDKLLRSYSTLEIAGNETNVIKSVSHYSVFNEIGGYRLVKSNHYAFDVVRIDGIKLSFDVSTGEIIK
jgi:hypothetical protein